MKIKAIVAYTKEGRVIGDGDKIPWYLPEDFKHFKESTMNCPVVMGRKTYESLPDKFKPLPKRINYVVTRSPTDYPLGLDPKTQPIYIRTLEAALSDPFLRPTFVSTVLGVVPENIWVIGGQQIYEKAIEDELLDEVIATEVKKEYNGDKFFQSLKVIGSQKW